MLFKANRNDRKERLPSFQVMLEIRCETLVKHFKASYKSYSCKISTLNRAHEARLSGFIILSVSFVSHGNFHATRNLRIRVQV